MSVGVSSTGFKEEESGRTRVTSEPIESFTVVMGWSTNSGIYTLNGKCGGQQNSESNLCRESELVK